MAKNICGVSFLLKNNTKKINIDQQLATATSYCEYCVKLPYLATLVGLENTDFLKLITVMQWKHCLGSVECIIVIKNFPVMLL